MRSTRGGSAASAGAAGTAARRDVRAKQSTRDNRRRAARALSIRYTRAFKRRTTATVFEPSAGKLWKRLTREERLAAAQQFFSQPPQEVYGTALGVIVRARKLRPQVARSMAPEEQAKALASVLDPGEPLAGSLLVARRPLPGAFLDAVGLAHEDGLLKEEADGIPFTAEAAQKGVAALRAAYPREQVDVYLNTLWLQDPEHWAPLEEAAG